MSLLNGLISRLYKQQTREIEITQNEEVKTEKVTSEVTDCSRKTAKFLDQQIYNNCFKLCLRTIKSTNSSHVSEIENGQTKEKNLFSWETLQRAIFSQVFNSDLSLSFGVQSLLMSSLKKIVLREWTGK